MKTLDGTFASLRFLFPIAVKVFRRLLLQRLHRDFEELDPVEFLARITSHIPDRRSHIVRSYGVHAFTLPSLAATTPVAISTRERRVPVSTERPIP